jgi:enamine deaminase RidA (YjgF/YER057c/UK114 family)
VVGYSRAVRVGAHVSVSGTAAMNAEGEVIGGNAYEQATRAIANVERALAEADAGLADVVRTRIYVTDIDDWEAIAEAHAEAFGEIRPATTMVEVRRLIELELVVEIEADAIVAEAKDNTDDTDGTGGADGTDDTDEADRTDGTVDGDTHGNANGDADVGASSAGGGSTD